MALNANSPLSQCSKDVNQVHGSTVAGIKYQSVQAGTGLLFFPFFTSFNRGFMWKHNYIPIHITELSQSINTTYRTVQLLFASTKTEQLP